MISQEQTFEDLFLNVDVQVVKIKMEMYTFLQQGTPEDGKIQGPDPERVVSLYCSFCLVEAKMKL